jgi:hypothetical protein
MVTSPEFEAPGSGEGPFPKGTLFFFFLFLSEVPAGPAAGLAFMFSASEAGCNVFGPDNGKATASEVDLWTGVGDPSQGDGGLTSSNASC